MPAAGGEVPPNAVPGGIDNEQLFVGRARHEGALLPGKIVPSHGVCYVPWGGGEHGKQEYEVRVVWCRNGLGNVRVRWSLVGVCMSAREMQRRGSRLSVSLPLTQTP